MSDKSPAIVWFRSDLRIADHPALCAAVETGRPVLALYIIDSAAEKPLGAASQWWLHHSLTAFQSDLKSIGLSLKIVTGDPEIVLPSIAQTTGAKHVFWNRRYDGYGVAKDTSIKTLLADDTIEAKSFKGNLLFEPWEKKTGSGGYYKVFTPFWKSCLAGDPPAPALDAPKGAFDFGGDIQSVSLESLGLLPTRPNWASRFSERFTPGSAGAFAKLKAFLDGPVQTYTDDRNRPDRVGTSRLSAHLAFGEISPRQIWHAAQRVEGSDKFLSEIGWREFSYTLLFYNPNLASENYKDGFDKFPWDDNPQALEAWQRGQTGYPFVDAGMRELWATGWQHNRVRMVTASFLIKHLLIEWQRGEEWFWDCLVDADPASNAASWQWVAGSGADASPYFRIFNPFTQGQKFDPNADYVRRWVPEIAALPDKYIQTPWDAPDHILNAAGIRLGKTYPKPIVDHKPARERALAGYAKTKDQS